MNGDRQENGITLPHLLRSPVGLPSICRVTIEMVLPLPRQPLCNHLISLLLQNCQFPAPNEPAHNQIASCVKKVELFLCQHTCSPFDSRPLQSLIPALARGYNKYTGEASLFDGKLSYIFRSFSQWHHILQEPWHDYERVMLLEVEARLRRIAQTMPSQPPLPTQQMTTRLHQKVEAMICFITEHYMEPLQLGQIAQAVGLHPGYATELFRKSFGLSIMGYLLQHRVAHAQRLLATTDQTVLNVAMEAGFTSASRFYATFQKITGQSPRAYRSSLLP